MAVAKVIELLSQSNESWEDAAQRAVTEASRTIKNIREVYIKEMEANVENNRITSYKLNVKISFVVEDSRETSTEERSGSSVGSRSANRKRSR